MPPRPPVLAPSGPQDRRTHAAASGTPGAAIPHGRRSRTRLLRPLASLGQVNWGLADQAVVSGGNFLTTLLLARWLGLEAFGSFAFAWMLVLLAGHLQQALVLAPMASLGPQQEAHAAPAYYAAVLGQQLLYAAASSLAIMAIAALLAAVGSGVQPQLLPPLLAAGFAYQNQEFLRRYGFARHRGGLALATDSLRAAGQVAAVAWLAGASSGPGLDAAGALWIMAGASALASCAGASALPWAQMRAAHVRATLVRHWRFARWLLGAFAAGWIRANSFLLAVWFVLGPAGLGTFRAGQVLLGMVQLVYFAAGSTAPAEAARTYASAGAAPLAAYLRRLAWFGVGTTAAALLAFTLAPAQLLELIFGAAYAAAAPLVPGLALFQALLFLDLALVTGLSVLDRTEQVWQATKWGPLMGLLLAYPLVAALGLQGAVLGCLVTMSAQIALEWRAFRAALRETPSRAHHAHAG